jgi:NAD(P)-dependent dehydrogenase (short-subunit alcohol dehydrogenase family)
MGNLDGRVAIGTGAGGGIGCAIADAFADEGAAVALADRNRAGAESVAEGIAARGGRALPIEVDVADEAGATRMVERTRAEIGGIDVLVNNAGIDTIFTLVDMPFAMWQEMLDTNLTGVSLHPRVLPTMIVQRRACTASRGRSPTRWRSIEAERRADADDASRALTTST